VTGRSVVVKGELAGALLVEAVVVAGLPEVTTILAVDVGALGVAGVVSFTVVV